MSSDPLPCSQHSEYEINYHETVGANECLVYTSYGSVYIYMRSRRGRWTNVQAFYSGTDDRMSIAKYSNFYPPGVVMSAFLQACIAQV